MEEKDIRPVKLKKKSDWLFAQDAKKFLIHKSEFVIVGCPVCRKTTKEVYFRKKGYIFRRCRTCQTIYISPRPTTELLHNYYATAKYYKYWMKYIFPASRYARINFIYKPRVTLLQKYLEKYHIERRLLVDVGAGSGDFGREVDKLKIFSNIFLIEPGEINVEESATLHVLQTVFEKAEFPHRPDVITCFETLEHLYSPDDFLQFVYKSLAENGLLMFSTVNNQGFDILMLGKKSEYLIGPDHLNIFTIDSIERLLRKIGFRKIEVTTPGQLDTELLLTAYKQKIIDLRKHPFLYFLLVEKGKIYREEFQKFLQEQKLSSHMLIVAQK